MARNPRKQERKLEVCPVTGDVGLPHGDVPSRPRSGASSSSALEMGSDAEGSVVSTRATTVSPTPTEAGKKKGKLGKRVSMISMKGSGTKGKGLFGKIKSGLGLGKE